MKTLHFPDCSDANPYQLLLKKGLEKQSVDVTLDVNFNLRRIRKGLDKWDILHVHWPNLFPRSTLFECLKYSVKSLLRFLIIRLMDFKLVWTVHNIRNHDSGYPFIELVFAKCLYFLSNQVILHSENCKVIFIETLNISDSEKINVIPHGNYIGVYDNSATIEESFDRLGLSTNKITYLYIGSVKPYKGIENLIESFKKLDNNASQLVIAGRNQNTTYTELLHKLIGDNSNIHSIFKFIPDNKLQHYFNIADIVVLPFTDIFTSGSLVLAMSFKKAVIIPRLGCVIDYLEQQDLRLSYSVDEPDGLPHTMQYANTLDRSYIQQVGIVNYNKAKSFDWDTIARDTLSVYMK